jgi:hypothetical protein
MKAWLATEAYTEVTATNACKSAAGGDVVAHAAGNGSGNDGTCKTECDGLKAWGMTGNLPSSAGGTGTGYCYGYQWKSNVCKHV